MGEGEEGSLSPPDVWSGVTPAKRLVQGGSITLVMEVEVMAEWVYEGEGGGGGMS